MFNVAATRHWTLRPSCRGAGPKKNAKNALDSLGGDGYPRPAMLECIIASAIQLFSPPAAQQPGAPMLAGQTATHVRTDWFVAELARARVERSDDGRSTEILAFNDSGDPIGAVRLWVSRGDIVHIRAKFQDGSLNIRTEAKGREPRVRISKLTFDVINSRLDAINDILNQNGGPQAGWLKCGLSVAATVAACAAAETGAGAIACVAGCGVSACECLPLFSEEFEDIEC